MATSESSTSTREEPVAITIRSARPADYPAFVGLFGELQVPDPVPSVEEFTTNLSPAMLVAEADDSVVGYITWRHYATATAVANVVVKPAWRGRRIGELLLERVREQARAAGSSGWYLNVKADNASAIRLYERCGFTIRHESFALVMPWSAALALPVEEGLQPRLLEPGDDGIVERTFGLDAGRVAALRARQGTVLIAVDGAAGLVGFAAFSPGRPGVFPFRMLRPSVAGNLLRACHDRADIVRFDFVRLTV